MWRDFLITDQLKGYINISRKAGYLIIGSDNLKNYSKKLYLVIYDKMAQKNTMKVVQEIAQKNISVLEIDCLDNLTGIKNCKIIITSLEVYGNHSYKTCTLRTDY